MLSRPAFMENALTLCAQQARRGEPVALLMFDLDHFKSINDRFGHAAGDEVLRVFGQVVRASTRADDIIARFGGEEFIAIVPGGLESANKIGERVRSSFEFSGATVGAHGIGATVSIGAAIAYEPVTALESLIGRADAALYRAKYTGRNRLCGRRRNGERANSSHRRGPPGKTGRRWAFCPMVAAQSGFLTAISVRHPVPVRNVSFTLFAVRYGNAGYGKPFRDAFA
jgi:diguanylate cyclase (GGDEF)-like protein